MLLQPIEAWSLTDGEIARLRDFTAFAFSETLNLPPMSVTCRLALIKCVSE